MKTVHWSAAAVLFGLIVVGGESPVSAELDGDGCAAAGSWRDGGFVVDARAIGNDVVTVPREDSVDWEGSVAGPPGEYSGSISVDLPPPFGEVEIDSWSGDSDTPSNFGTEAYDLPSLVPAGVEFEVVGSHTDANGTCSGSVRMEVDGGAFDSPLTIVSLLGTIASGAGFAMLARPIFTAGRE
jgi:hypothetical protein